MKKYVINILRATVAVLTALIVIAYFFLPLKAIDLLSKHAELGIYADGINGGGNSTNQWVNQEAHHFQCEVKPSETSRFCGIAIKQIASLNPYKYKSLDLRDFHQLLLDVEYHGPADRLFFFYRNSDASNQGANKMEANQFIFTYISKGELKSPLKIPLDSFDLADWWLRENYTTRSQIQRRRDVVLELGIATDLDPELGVYDFKLRALFAQGQWINREQLYFCIIVIWLFGIILEVTHRIILMMKEKRHYALRLNELRKEFRQLEQTATKDPLTNTYNRAGFLKIANYIASNIESDTWYVVLFDIDHFKSINDTYGHDAGDVVLQQFSERVKYNIREEDYFSRWGGEEFVLLAKLPSDDAAKQFADKIRHVIGSHPFSLPEGVITVTASIGISQFSAAIPLDTAMSQADKNLYFAKNNGRNQVCFNLKAA